MHMGRMSARVCMRKLYSVQIWVISLTAKLFS